MKEKHAQELKHLEEKYNSDLYEKSSAIDDRMIELKEEHDNQLHNLRVEMEHELLAEKRKSIAENEQNLKDIQKLQKDFREIESEIELKTLKITGLKMESKTNTEELKKLRAENQQLKQTKNHLQILWENQEPKRQAQKQQIASLQKLNRELSLHIQESKLKDYDYIENKSEKQQNNPSHVNQLLKDIHIHNNP